MSDPGKAPSPDSDRTAEGIDHLQAAALEMIEAARAFLDVMEDVVGDRDKIEDAVAAVGSLARAAGRGGPGNNEDDRDGTENTHVERITLSS
jgi:hypothetical protein